LLSSNFIKNKLIKIDISSESDDEEEMNVDKKRNPVLITELDEDMFDNDSLFDSDNDDDELIIPKKKVINYKIYENNIENDKDYDTDLEGELLVNKHIL
jgi:hypothetical protein